ncbi:MAG: hypothetical protein Q9160_000440 [Pyrenula sp. 1 TL-2023]
MMVIGENTGRAINDYSRQFQSDFVKLLRTSHHEKRVHINHFYQEYIRDKNHLHMNSTRWNSLTEFAKHLGREGVCRVDEEEGDESGRGAGLYISWIDNSPEALRREDALRKKERQERGDEERELQDIEEQIRRARNAGGKGEEDEIEEDAKRELQRSEGEKIKLNFGGKQLPKPPSPPLTDKSEEEMEQQSKAQSPAMKLATPESQTPSEPPASKPTFKFGGSAPNKLKNVFATAKKTNPLGGNKKTTTVPAQQKPRSEAERIMKEEMERKRLREEGKFNPAKRQRV